MGKGNSRFAGQIHYKMPILYDDEVIVRTSLIKPPTAKLFFDYLMLNDQGEVHCEARTTLVFVDAATRKPIRVPKFFEELISPYY